MTTETQHPSGDLLADYFSKEQLASALKRTPRTIERWLRLRVAPPVTRIGNDPYFRKEAVREWLLSREARTLHKPAKRSGGHK